VFRENISVMSDGMIAAAKEDKRRQIEEALEKVRPYLRKDGGDVRLVRVTDDGIVELQWEGACVNCPMSVMTLRAGVERTLLLKVPGIRRVEAISVSD